MQINEVMILLHLQQQNDQLPKFLLHFSAIWKVVENMLDFCNQFAGSPANINPHLTT